MIKLEFTKYCFGCEHAKIDITHKPGKVLYDESTGVYQHERVIVIGCIHRQVCNKYIFEPLHVLPVEKLFGDQEAAQ